MPYLPKNKFLSKYFIWLNSVLLLGCLSSSITFLRYGSPSVETLVKVAVSFKRSKISIIFWIASVTWGNVCEHTGRTRIGFGIISPFEIREIVMNKASLAKWILLFTNFCFFSSKISQLENLQQLMHDSWLVQKPTISLLIGDHLAHGLIANSSIFMTKKPLTQLKNCFTVSAL